MAMNSHELYDDFACDDESSRKNKRPRVSEEASEAVSQQLAENQESCHYQRRIWDGMQKRIDALIKKLSSSNIRDISTELFFNNLIRGRGLLCRSIINASMVSPNSIPVLASLVAVINSKLPEVGYLLLKRIIVQLKHEYGRGEKKKFCPLARLLAQLINHGVVRSNLATELLHVLLDEPSEDNVDTAVTFLLECGYLLQRIDEFAMDVYETLKEIKNLGKEKKSQCLIAGLIKIWQDRFVGFKEPKDDLDLVNIGDQITHKLSFLDKLDPEFSVDGFRVDLEFMENEEKYAVLREGFLGEASSSTYPK